MKNNVVFLSCTENYGYQFSAANTKVEFLAKGLMQLGDICTIHNGIIGNPNIKAYEVKEISGVGTVITYSKKVGQLISWAINLPRLAKDLKCLYKSGYKNILILSMADYHIFLVYVALARIYGYKIVVISHEWGPTVSTTHPLRKPSVGLYSQTFGYFADGILPISEFIIRKIKHFKRPYIKIPITADYSLRSQGRVNDNGEYFLYCVYAAYSRVIFKIIDAYLKFRLHAKSELKLVLILSGNEEQRNYICDYINRTDKGGNVIVKHKVPYKVLMDLYYNARALIIPLDPTSQQDEARFSQKIAEYLSSGSPIISNNVGEIKSYFTDKKNIVLCDYSTDGFAGAFEWVMTHPGDSKQIGIDGFSLGQKEFDYRKLSKDLHNYLIKL